MRDTEETPSSRPNQNVSCLYAVRVTPEEHQALNEEWQANEAKIEALPLNHAERQRLEGRQDEIEFLIGEAQLKERRSSRMHQPRVRLVEGGVEVDIVAQHEITKVEVTLAEVGGTGTPPQGHLAASGKAFSSTVPLRYAKPKVSDVTVIAHLDINDIEVEDSDIYHAEIEDRDGWNDLVPQGPGPITGSMLRPR